jgi:hypothetical protein
LTSTGGELTHGSDVLDPTLRVSDEHLATFANGLRRAAPPE